MNEKCSILKDTPARTTGSAGAVDPLVIRDFPVCQTGRRIPWSVAERAYEGYVKQYGRCQTLERLAKRGGFYVEELDQLYPAWREEVEEIYLLRKEVERLKAVQTERDKLLDTVKLAYRKHHMDDSAIGWEELDTKLLDALCSVMGDGNFCKWLESV